MYKYKNCFLKFCYFLSSLLLSYRYGKQKHGRQKYIYCKCHYPFALKTHKNFPQRLSQTPICSNNIFVWHQYNFSIYFKYYIILKNSNTPLIFLPFIPTFIKKSFSHLPNLLLKDFTFFVSFSKRLTSTLINGTLTKLILK